MVANANLTLNTAGSLGNFSGDIKAADSTVTLKGANVGTDSTEATFSGNGTLDVQASQTLETTAALDSFTGTVKIAGEKVVTLNGVNDTDAAFSGAGKLDLQNNQTLGAAGALNNLTGTLNNGGYDLTLDGANTIGATVTGSGNINANADQSFTGNVSGYTGTYTANTNATTGDYTVTFSASSTLAASMTLNGEGKFVLAGNGKEVTVNSDSTSNTTLDIAGNCITLNSGKYDALSGSDNSKLIVKADDLDKSQNEGYFWGYRKACAL